MSARTPSQTVGPFFDFCLTADTAHGTVFPESAQRLRLLVRVIDGAGNPVPDGIVEIWQACDRPGGDAWFGRLGTRADGTCEFDTVRPCDPADGGAAHVNICLFARGLLHHLYTRLYFDGDPRLASDPVLALVPESRRATLIATPAAGPENAGHNAAASTNPAYTIDIRLQGDRETVFFDV